MIRRICIPAVLIACAAASGAEQRKIDRIEQMPNHPRPYAMRDWAKVARDYDALAFDFRAKGEHLPLIWRDTTKHNYPFAGFGLPSYVGSAYQRSGNQHESINCIAAVVGASLVGIDKSGPAGRNFVRMCQKYFNKDNAQRLYLNHTAFNYRTMAPADNGRWKEPDAAAAYAWFLYMTAVKTGNAKYRARRDDAGDADRGFAFSFAVKPDGPYTPMFTVTADRDRIHGYALSAKLTGTLYVKVEDTDRTPGQRRPDRLHVDSLFIVYELSRGPYAMGDWGLGGYPHAMATDFGLYGSSHVGYLGGIVRTTDVAEVLRLDLLKTDWYHAPAYPTWLYFNPHAAARTVHLDVGGRPRDLYDTVTNRFLVRAAVGRTPITIPPDSAALIVVCPAAGKVTRRASKLLVDGIIVDHHTSP